MKRSTLALTIGTLILSQACSSSGDLEEDMSSSGSDGGNTSIQRDTGTSSTRDTGSPTTDTGTTTPDMNTSTPDIGADTATETDMGTADQGMGTDMGTCPDIYEPNNTAAEAKPVMSGDVIRAANCGFDDDDVYKIDLTTGQQITLTHTFVNADGNLDLNLHAPSQMNDVGKNGSYAAITFSFDDEEVLTHTAEETGTYYILSFNNNESENPYTLAVQVQ